jgi:hypothetical protein
LPQPLTQEIAMTRTGTPRFAILFAALLACLPMAARAQDYGAMIQQQMNLMNQRLAQGQNMVQQMVQQRMQDPRVQQAWQQYLAQSGGRPAMDYPTFTYNYIYTAGFSAAGIQHARNAESRNQAGERAAYEGYRQAQQQRAGAMQDQRNGYFAQQQEAGRGLMGQSTYQGAGTSQVLPHTWQQHSLHEYQGRTYYVDQSGQYFVRESNGWWTPVRR